MHEFYIKLLENASHEYAKLLHRMNKIYFKIQCNIDYSALIIYICIKDLNSILKIWLSVLRAIN